MSYQLPEILLHWPESPSATICEDTLFEVQAACSELECASRQRSLPCRQNSLSLLMEQIACLGRRDASITWLRQPATLETSGDASVANYFDSVYVTLP